MQQLQRVIWKVDFSFITSNSKTKSHILKINSKCVNAPRNKYKKPQFHWWRVMLSELVEILNTNDVNHQPPSASPKKCHTQTNEQLCRNIYSKSISHTMCTTKKRNITHPKFINHHEEGVLHSFFLPFSSRVFFFWSGLFVFSPIPMHFEHHRFNAERIRKVHK